MRKKRVSSMKNYKKKHNTPEIILLSCSIIVSHSEYFAASCACELVFSSHLVRIQINNKTKRRKLFLFFSK
jgi:hypothetical protein